MRAQRFFEFLTLTIVLLLAHGASAQSVTPLNAVPIGVTLPANTGLNNASTTVPLATGTDTTLFNAMNVIKIDSEYLLVSAVTKSNQDNPGAANFLGYSTLT